jgi:Uma2 family endonuclease
MTVIDRPMSRPDPQSREPQRFVFDEVSWSFYKRVCEEVEDRRVFVTYYKGRLEIVTTSLLHEAVSRLLYSLLKAIAEETNTPIRSAGATTLEREDLAAAVAADESFYIGPNEQRMRNKKKIDLAVDPPPDLAIEVEITARLGVRKQIYRDIGVPEIWRYGDGGLTVLVRRGEQYEQVERSPTFPQLSPQELSGFVAAGLAQDETAWIKSFRRRLREAMA